MDEFHRILDDDERALRRFLRLEDQDIPQPVQDAYWELKRIRDGFMAGAPIHPDVLAMLVMQVAKVPADPAVNEAERLIKSGELPMETEIVVRWRGKEKLAKFLGYNAGPKTFACKFQSDPQVRTIPIADAVAVHEPAGV